MPFPVMIPIGPWSVPAHPVFEGLGLFVGARLYFHLRKKDPAPTEVRWGVLAGAALGAGLGAHLLHALNELPRALVGVWPYRELLVGKTIVGAILGGWGGVEVSKRALGEPRSTGDLFVAPLLLGIAIGRVGCFLTGLSDFTCGSPTRMPWGVDFGDGIPRHPCQLYEIALLVLFAMLIPFFRRWANRSGDLFRIFVAYYLLIRLCLDALKPDLPLALRLSGIQWACLLGLLLLAPTLRRILFSSELSTP